MGSEYLGQRLWEQLRAALDKWANSGFAGAAAITAWAQRAPVLPDAVLRRMSERIDIGRNISSMWSNAKGGRGSIGKGKDKNGRERD